MKAPQMTKPKVRLSDIAKAVGVSTATVSRALNGESYVRQDLMARIHQTAREMNYRLPQALSGQKVLLITSEAAMLDMSRNQFTLYVLEGLRHRARKLGAELEVLTLGDTPNAALRRAASRADLGGALLMTVDDWVLPYARQLNCPVVLVNGDDPDMVLNSVTPCNRSAAALATRHLRDRGHDHIAFLTKPGRRTIKRRLEGWQDISGSGHIIETKDWTAEAAAEAVARVVKADLPFTAIVAAGDALAAGAMQALSSAGLRIPADVSVVGIDGLPLGEFLSPSLTTVAIPMKEVGQQALNLLCDIIKERQVGDEKPVRRIELACTLILRDSTAHLPPAAAPDPTPEKAP